MALNAKEWILKGIGDSSDARRDLDETAAKLDAFDGSESQAEVDLQTQRFKEELQAAKAELKALDSETAEPDVDLNTAGLKLHIREIEAQLAVLGQRTVHIDTDIDTNAGRRSLTGFLGFVKSVWDGVGNIFTQGAQSVGSSMVGMGGQVSSEGTASLSTFGKVAGEASAVVGIAMVAAIGAGITALVALAASAGAAALALGALAVAAGALVIPFGVVAAGAIAVFKDTADQAGTAANALKERAKGIADTFKSVLRPAADAVFRGLTGALKGVPTLLRALQPAFTTLGKAIGGAFTTLGTELTSPAWQRFFKLLANAAAQVVPLLTGSFIQFARILRNIATAAMPFLIQGLKALNQWLKGISGSTSNSAKLRQDIGGLVEHLKAWIKLGAQLAGGFFGLLKAAAPIGLQIVKWLTQGATALADWVSSSEGQARIKQFFEDVLPLIKEMVTFFAQLAVVAIEVFQAIAPALATVFAGLNLLLKPVIFLLDLFNRIPASVRSWLLPFGAVIATVTNLISAARLLPGAWSAVTGAIGAAANAIKNAVAGPFNTMRAIVGNVFGAVKDFVSGALNKLVVGPFVARARLIGQGIVAGINLARTIIGKMGDFIGGALGKVAGAVGNFLGAAAKLGKSVVTGITQGAIGIGRAVFDKLHSAIDGIRSFAGDFFNVGKAIIQAMVNGVKDAAGALADAAKNAVKGALDGAKSLLPGSEPKDKSSPFRNLAASGKATVDNFMRGLNAELPRIEQAFRDISMPSPLVSPAVAGAGGAGGAGHGDTQIGPFTINAPAGEQPDAEATLALINMKLRARGMR